MVHPNVLEMAGFDSNVYSGFAFGMGPDRIAMLKYGIEDIRHFYTNDVRFLDQFKAVEDRGGVMLISNEWLKDYVDAGVAIEDLAERITRTGIEVDDIIDYTKDIKNLVVGYIQSKEKHPDADKLNICQVDIGEKLFRCMWRT